MTAVVVDGVVNGRHKLRISPEQSVGPWALRVASLAAVLAQVLAHEYHRGGAAAVKIIRQLTAVEIEQLRKTIHRHADAVLDLPPVYRDCDEIARLHHADAAARVCATQMTAPEML